VIDENTGKLTDRHETGFMADEINAYIGDKNNISDISIYDCLTFIFQCVKSLHLKVSKKETLVSSVKNGMEYSFVEDEKEMKKPTIKSLKNEIETLKYNNKLINEKYDEMKQKYDDLFDIVMKLKKNNDSDSDEIISNDSDSQIYKNKAKPYKK
jgi:predicted nuclease with TOPRIM domain